MALLAVAGGVSPLITPRANRRANLFSWEPFREVAVLVVAIFVTMAPVLALLQAGPAGPFGAVLALTAGPDGKPLPAMYFWFTGLLSAFLDDAQTSVVFFELAGGDLAVLTSERSTTLVAISAGAVFMGGMTYIGNAPNFMIRGIAARRGVRMPGFFGFMGRSLVLMLPPLGLVTLFFFVP